MDSNKQSDWFLFLFSANVFFCFVFVGAREIDIAATLEHLRDQRTEAVRNKQQFEFVLTAVAEEVHAILRALPQ